MTGFTPLDLAVLVAYLLGVTAWGAWLGRGQKGGTDYFLGSRALPWVAVMLSVVATETSTLTFLSIPGVSYAGSLVFLQLTFGYLAGRILVSVVLLPAYYGGHLTTAYELLERRFGLGARRFTSAIFMVTRLLADSVRLFATAIPLALITGWPYGESIAVIGVLTVVYTYFGGIKAVVWVDAAQMALYLFGAIVAVFAIQTLLPDGWGGVLGDAAAAGKLDVLDFSLDPTVAYTVFAGVLGGAVFTMASHGTDQLIVQRLLTCTDQRSAQKALIGSGVAVIVQFLLFLMVGLGLWAFYGGRAFDTTDEIFARFIVEQLPPGLTGLLIAGVFAAAMSSLSSSINSLASASAYDYWAPMVGARDDEVRILRAGKVFTLLWALLLIVGATLFIPLSRQTSAVEVALGVASLVYGGLLGAFALAVLTRRPGQIAAIVGIAAGIGTVTAFRASMAWPWYVLVGSLVTLAVGSIVGFFDRRDVDEEDATRAPGGSEAVRPPSASSTPESGPRPARSARLVVLLRRRARVVVGVGLAAAVAVPALDRVLAYSRAVTLRLSFDSVVHRAVTPVDGLGRDLAPGTVGEAVGPLAALAMVGPHPLDAFALVIQRDDTGDTVAVVHAFRDDVVLVGPDSATATASRERAQTVGESLRALASRGQVRDSSSYARVTSAGPPDVSERVVAARRSVSADTPIRVTLRRLEWGRGEVLLRFDLVPATQCEEAAAGGFLGRGRLYDCFVWDAAVGGANATVIGLTDPAAADRLGSLLNEIPPLLARTGDALNRADPDLAVASAFIDEGRSALAGPDVAACYEPGARADQEIRLLCENRTLFGRLLDLSARRLQGARVGLSPNESVQPIVPEWNAITSEINTNAEILMELSRAGGR